MNTISQVRPSPIAGAWYSGDPSVLAASVKRYIDEAVLPPLPGQVMGVIAPHAGHLYSGRTAGHAFRAIRGQERELAVVVSPLHSFNPSPYVTTAHAAYATPLGAIPVDKAALGQLQAELTASGSVGLTALANDQEHSLEIELPFLQCALAGKFSLLPLMVRTQSANSCQRLGYLLARVIQKRNFVLVASTDLSHFYSQPVAERYDQEMLRQFAAFSPEGVLNAEQNASGFACGAGAVAVVMWTAQALGAQSAVVLHHSTSGDQTGDLSSVVGYGAAAILKP